MGTIIEARDSSYLDKKLKSMKNRGEEVTVQTPSGMSRIEKYSFWGNTSVNKVIISDRTRTVDDQAFCECKNLTEVSFPETLEGIGNWSFAECDLRRLDLPASLEYIGAGAFSMNSFEEVIIPEGATTIQRNAFSDCPRLRRIRIPSSVRYIGINAFGNCPLLEEVEIGDERKTLESRESVIAHNDEELNFLGLYRDLKAVIIPNGYKRRGHYYNSKFYNWTTLLGEDVHACEFGELFRDGGIDEYRDRILDELTEDDYNNAEKVFNGDDESLLKLFIAGCARMPEKNGAFLEKISRLLDGCPELGRHKDILAGLPAAPALKPVLDSLDSSTREQKAALEGIIEIQKEIEEIKEKLTRAKAKKKDLLEKFNSKALERIDRFIEEKLKQNGGLIELFRYPRFEVPTETVASRLRDSTAYSYDIQIEEPFIIFKKADSIREGERSHLPIVTWKTGRQEVGEMETVYEQYFSELPMDEKLEFYRILSGPERDSWGNYVERCPTFLGGYLQDHDDVAEFQERLQSYDEPSGPPTYPEPLSLTQKKIQNLRYRRNENPDLEHGRKIVEIDEGILVIPEGVKAIGRSRDEVPITDYVKWPDKVTSVVFPDSLEVIGDRAFSGCSSLKSLVIPEGVVRIGDRAFSDCSSLESIIIPEGISMIGASAFQGCTMLKSLSIPASVTEIKEGETTETLLFGHSCCNLESITVAEGNPVYDSRNGCNAIIRSDKGRLLLGCVNTVIPEGVASIAWCAFRGCGIKSVSFPESVMAIGRNAFEGCEDLTEVTFNEGLESIGYEAFSHCRSLRKIFLPSSMKMPLPYSTYRSTKYHDDWFGAAFKDCIGLEFISIPRRLSFTATEETARQVRRCSGKALKLQLGLRDLLHAGGWFDPGKVEVIVRERPVPKSQSILVDLAYDDHHMVCKVGLHLLDRLSYYEYKDGEYGSCLLAEPFQEHFAGIYLVDSALVKDWKTSKTLDDGRRFGLNEFEEQMKPLLASSCKMELEDFWY